MAHLFVASATGRPLLLEGGLNWKPPFRLSRPRVFTFVASATGGETYSNYAQCAASGLAPRFTDDLSTLKNSN